MMRQRTPEERFLNSEAGAALVWIGHLVIMRPSGARRLDPEEWPIKRRDQVSLDCWRSLWDQWDELAILAEHLDLDSTPIHEFRLDPTLRAGERLVFLMERLAAREWAHFLSHGNERPPAGWTMAVPSMRDLADAVGVSSDTFNRVRTAARIEVKSKGGAARMRRYSPAEVDRLIAAALAGNFMERKAMAEKWGKWGTKAAFTPHAGN